MLGELATPCPFQVADAGCTITTTFANGKKANRLVFDTCATSDLEAMVTCLGRLRDACAETALPPRDQ
jgi:hypothetical protein